jgi:hypothetical protein
MADSHCTCLEEIGGVNVKRGTIRLARAGFDWKCMGGAPVPRVRNYFLNSPRTRFNCRSNSLAFLIA